MPVDRQLGSSHRWTVWSWLLIGVVALLWLAHWPRFPIFFDFYYHLHVMRGFARGGGVVLHDFWDYAPVGRPHLYPPLVHLLLLFAVRCGVPILVVARVVTALMFPVLLAVLRWMCSIWFDRRTGWWVIVVALVPYTLLLQASAALAASVAMVLLLLTFGAVERGRAIAAGCLVGLLWYTHLGIPWVAVVALSVYAWLRPDRRVVVVRSLALGVAIALPWLVHLMRHRQFIVSMSVMENRFVEYYPVLYLLAAVGIWMSWRRGGRALIGVAMMAGFLLLLPSFRYRFFNGEGLLATVLLAGCALSGMHDRLAGRVAATWRGVLVWGVALAIWIVSPSISLSQESSHVAWRESSLWRLTTWLEQEPKGNDLGLYDHWMADTVQRVQRLAAPDEIIWCNFRYTASLLGAMADRAISTGALFLEVVPDNIDEPVQSAGLAVWIKDPSQEAARDHQRLLDRYQLDLVEETEFAEFFRHRGVDARIHPVPAVVPTGVAWSLLASLVGVCVCAWDSRRT